MDTSNIFKYGNNIIWSLPLLFTLEPCYGALFKALTDINVTLPQVNIFGAYSNLTWSGGRYGNKCYPSPKQIQKSFEYIKTFNGIPTLTFTNTMLEKKHLDDIECNKLLDLAMEYNAHFIVFSDMLKDYIKTRYPKSYVVASIIKPIFEFQDISKRKYFTFENETLYYNKLSKEYDMIVIRPEYTLNFLLSNPDALDDLSKIEVLINNHCLENCYNAIHHYNFISKAILGEINEHFKCIKHQYKFKSSTALTSETIQKLVNIGINHLKIQGRFNGIPPLSILSLISNKMFNTEGKYDYLFNSHIPYIFPYEQDLFNMTINNDNK